MNVLSSYCMTHSSHPMEPAPTGSQHAFLEQAFSDFIAASAKLERSYRDLQSQVAELTLARLQGEQALRRSLTEQEQMLQRMERILCSVPCGVLLLAATGDVVHANPEAVRLLALTAAQMPDLTALLETDMPAIAADVSSDPHKGDLSETILTLVSSEGQHWIAVKRIPLRPATLQVDNTSPAWLLTLQDITSQKRAEQERARAHDAAALAQVSALLAHEIRNPLASMELFADLLLQAPEQAPEWISHLRAGIRSLAGTVNNVLLLSDADLQRSEVLDLVVELPPIFQFLQPLALQAEVAFTLHLQETPMWVRVDRTSLHQLLLNLCTNAFRYTANYGQVQVRCDTSSEGTPQLHVCDAGRGIQPDRLHRIFEPGYSDTRLRTGLGLAVCQRLMRQHGGHIRVASTPDAGSTFTLEFLAA